MKKKCNLFSSLTMMILTGCMLLSGHTQMGCVNAAVKTQCTTYSGNNINAQNYSTWSSTVKSYLTATNDGYMRVQSASSVDGYLVEYYDTAYNIQETKKITKELPVFGAFYETEDSYYILSGQNNPEESDEVEVYRITKYDKSWKRINSCGLYGANTYIPFDAGSARMAHSGNQLVILTCHEMYKSSDGYHHQANVTIQVDMDKMTITDSYTKVGSINSGYASHSFNQFVGVDDNHIISINHGDAYPRSIVLVKYGADISSGKFSSGSCNNYDLLKFDGKIGDNYTGASIGGFAISNSSYIVAGNQDINADNTSGGRNIFILSQNKSNNTITRTDITDYSEGDGAYTPHLITLAANRYLLLWSKKGVTYYTELNGTGAKTGNIYSLEGELSDCVPIVTNGKVVWYTWKNENITFYEISTSDLSKSNTVLIENGHKYAFSEVDANGMVTKKCTQCGDSSKYTAPTTFFLWWGTLSNASSAYASRYAVGDILYAWKDGLDGDPAVQDLEFISSNPEVVSTEYYSSTREKFNMNSPGIAQVTARLKYNPSVSKTYIFRVGSDGEVSLNDCTLNMDEYYIYKGKAVEPTFTLTYKGQPLVKNTDYTVEYSNNTAIGTGTVTITGKGLFSGNISRKFNIVETMPDEEKSPQDDKNQDDKNPDDKKLPENNTIVTDTKTGVSYKVTKSSATNGEVQYIGTGKEAKGTVTIPDAVNLNGVSYKVTSIAKDAFKSNKSITKVTVGKNITTIEKNAFNGCTKLKTITLGSNVTKIDEKAFYNCTSLKKITIPSKVNKIGKSAFEKCKNLKNITIKTTKLSKAKVGKKAFKGIAAKATIKVPAKKLAAYKKMLKARGVSKKAKIKK